MNIHIIYFKLLLQTDRYGSERTKSVVQRIPNSIVCYYFYCLEFVITIYLNRVKKNTKLQYCHGGNFQNCLNCSDNFTYLCGLSKTE